MWVCRAGRGEKDIELFLENNKIYLAWEGYDVNLSSIKDFQQIKELVISEKHPEARTSLSNWSTQINVFINLMVKGDYVLLPYPKSRYYALAKITGDYTFEPNFKYHHSRRIKILKRGVPREAFAQNIRYSLGAFRTVFNTKYDDEILKVVNEWNGE